MADILTKRQREILTIMRDKAGSDDGELMYDCGRGYLGLSPVAGRTVFALLSLFAIRAVSPMSGGCERYTISETGRHLLATGQLPAELLTALRGRPDAP